MLFVKNGYIIDCTTKSVTKFGLESQLDFKKIPLNDVTLTVHEIIAHD